MLNNTIKTKHKTKSTAGDSINNHSTSELRTEKAKLLWQQALASNLSVQFAILSISAMLSISYPFSDVVIWTIATTCVIITNFLHAKLIYPDGIKEHSADQFLRWQLILCWIYGITLGIIPFILVDLDDRYSIFLCAYLVYCNTAGGVVLNSGYRSGYITIAFCVSVPFGIYLILAEGSSYGIVGAGIIMYFAFGFIVSARADLDTKNASASLEKSKMTNQIIEQRESLRQINEEKTRFFAATSHDLSQPLLAQRNHIDILAEKITNPEHVKLLDGVKRAWKEQNALLEGIAEINKLESGSVQTQIAHVMLDNELTQSIAAFKSGAEVKGIRITSSLEKIQVETDPQLFARIVSNLISNAIRFTGRNGEIKIGLKSKNDHAVVSIIDNGRGIPEDMHEEIFHEYFRLEQNDENKIPGLGLGLSIVKKLSTLLKIEIQLSSSLGVGTQFDLKIPKFFE